MREDRLSLGNRVEERWVMFYKGIRPLFWRETIFFIPSLICMEDILRKRKAASKYQANWAIIIALWTTSQNEELEIKRERVLEPRLTRWNEPSTANIATNWLWKNFKKNLVCLFPSFSTFESINHPLWVTTNDNLHWTSVLPISCCPFLPCFLSAPSSISLSLPSRCVSCIPGWICMDFCLPWFFFVVFSFFPAFASWLFLFRSVL